MTHQKPSVSAPESSRELLHEHRSPRSGRSGGPTKKRAHIAGDVRAQEQRSFNQEAER